MIRCFYFRSAILATFLVLSKLFAKKNIFFDIDLISLSLMHCILYSYVYLLIFMRQIMPQVFLLIIYNFYLCTPKFNNNYTQ